MAAGVERGDRVGIWAPNVSEWILAALGIHFAGGVLVPLNTRYKAAEVGYVLRKSRARLLTESHNPVTFEDVAGCEESKFELEEIIAFLKEPKKFTRLGGRIPKGVLLVGPRARARRCWRER